jgi:pimeloyl-ACP methyl ester carboxylesterase
LFIHGNLASTRWWTPALRELRELTPADGRSAPALTADWRGCGRSAPWDNQDLFTIDDLAADFITLLDAKGLDQVNVVGHSLGGLIAVSAMAQDPLRFHRAVLLDPVGATGVVFDTSMYEAFRAMAQDRELTGQVLASTIHQNPLSAAEFAPLVDDAFKAVKGIGSSVLEILKNVDLRGQLAAVPTPTLVLFGEKDSILSAHDAQLLAEGLPEGVFEMVQNQGHCWNLEDPAGFARRTWTYLFG